MKRFRKFGLVLKNRNKKFKTNSEVCPKIELSNTAKEGPVRIQYKCLVLIYVFPEMELHSFVIPKRN
jgi:hypothetical protein